MIRQLFTTIALALIALLLPSTALASGHDGDNTEAKEGVDAQGIIFDHLGDGYGWEVPFNHHKRVPCLVYTA
ncbi:MAG: hypothetical protein K2L29_04335, partial [Duncaniella sp.]|nr:hypothetical protein [Duncaniella sp.]